MAPDAVAAEVVGGPDAAAESLSLGARMLAAYRATYETHTDDPVLRMCPHCRVSRCKPWQHARARLMASGESLPESTMLIVGVPDGTDKPACAPDEVSGGDPTAQVDDWPGVAP